MVQEREGVRAAVTDGGGVEHRRKHSRRERQNVEHLPKGVLEGLSVYDCICLEALPQTLLAQDLP